MRGALKLEIAGIEVGSCTPVPRNGGGGLKRDARITPGLEGYMGCSHVQIKKTKKKAKQKKDMAARKKK